MNINISFSFCTVRSYRTLKVSATEKEVTWLIVGWVAALVVLPPLMSYGVMPLWRDDMHNYSNFSPYLKNMRIKPIYCLHYTGFCARCFAKMKIQFQLSNGFGTSQKYHDHQFNWWS